MDKLEQLSQDFDELLKRVNEQLPGASGKTTELGATSPIDFVPPPTPTPPSPQNNLLRDGDFSFSTNSWNDSVFDAGDKNKECAWWYSNDGPIAASQSLDFTNAETSSVNQTLKASTHSTYDPAYCDWGLPHGIARMTGTKSLDAPFPGSPVIPGRPLYLGIARAAKASAQIVFPDTCRLGAALYSNTGGSEDIITGANAFELRGSVRFTTTPPATTTERRYKILARTDRGYEFLSTELILANAPSDAAFTAGGVDDYLSWDKIDGAIEYVVYRHDITAGKFRILEKVTSGSTTYGDNNKILSGHDDEGGYPSASDDRVKCYVATESGVLSQLPIDGVDPQWGTLFLNIPVPDPLLASGAGNQVLRLCLTAAMDRQLDVATISGDQNITTVDDQFIDALDVGRTVILTSEDGLHTLTTTVDSFVNTKTLKLTDPPDWSANSSMYIVEGGDHGLLIDLVHIGYTKQAGYAGYFEDQNRVLPPTAAPDALGQGGIGGTGDNGDPGGGGLCVTMDMPITYYIGNQLASLPYRLIERFCLFSGNLRPNWIARKRTGRTLNVHHVLVRASWFFDVFLGCSPGHPIITHSMSENGSRADVLKANDEVFIHIDGNLSRKRVRTVEATGKADDVGTFVLGPGHLYAAGELRFRSKIHQFLFWLLRKRKPVVGILSHNRKNDGGDLGA